MSKPGSSKFLFIRGLVIVGVSRPFDDDDSFRWWTFSEVILGFTPEKAVRGVGVVPGGVGRPCLICSKCIFVLVGGRGAGGINVVTLISAFLAVGFKGPVVVGVGGTGISGDGDFDLDNCP